MGKERQLTSARSKEKPKRVRKNRYVPDLAAARFRPTEDWSTEEAKERYYAIKFPFEVDAVLYEDCIRGLKRLPQESVNVVIADPPFGLNFTGKETIYNRDERLVREGYREVEEDYFEFSLKWIKEIPRIMKKSGSAWIFSGWTNLAAILNAARETGLILTNHIIWKYQFGVFTKRKFVTSHYHVLFLTKGPDYYFNKVMHYPLDVWDIKRTYHRGEIKNSTKLPEDLIARCIDFTSRPGDLVLDPFMGNGTTAVAAKGSFRHYLGFEINETMKEVIEANIRSTKLGGFYVPYGQREDDLVVRARRKYKTLLESESSVSKLDRFYDEK
ncbi:MAG: site-specific DNA-methyltransferase [Thaumarchaeota archaeon]|nr:site-specific DNA-methyltransferase [Nitrososphaerota archaeon]